MHWLAQLYARRIVNVNVNIVLAGLLALPPVALVVHLLGYFGMNPTHTIGFWRIHVFTVSAVTLAADLVFDFSIYLGLHWLANHHPWRNRLLAPADKLLEPAHKLLEPAHKGLSFIHDAGLVQFERAVLSPLLYAVWIGLQSFLINNGVGPVRATVVGCVCGITVARCLHTLWMLRQERRRHRRLAAANSPPAAAQSIPKRISSVR